MRIFQFLVRSAIIGWAVRVIAICVFGKDRQRYLDLLAWFTSLFGPLAHFNLELPVPSDLVDEPTSAHVKTVVLLAHIDGGVVELNSVVCFRLVR
ncbi:hypothetical protein F5Y04DRAFT_241654 [Hypomontagnella monticulosa]|nr:hypothetical protein F5Y04DRAFT_241654 [Hypomontagnella monticulosa]